MALILNDSTRVERNVRCWGLKDFSLRMGSSLARWGECKRSKINSPSCARSYNFSKTFLWRVGGFGWLWSETVRYEQHRSNSCKMLARPSSRGFLANVKIFRTFYVVSIFLSFLQLQKGFLIRSLK